MNESVSPTAAARAAAILFIHAQTGLHPGSGTALGTVDLPVQRERHTQWPVIPGSTLKGILRDACRPSPADGTERQTWLAVFGPETSQARDHAGALSLTDARILAFPVRSLRGVFAWVTCGGVLERLRRDLDLSGTGGELIDLPPKWPAKDKAYCPAASPLLAGGNKLVLEEFEFERTTDAGQVPDWVSTHAVADERTRQRLQSHFVVLHDDDFTHFVRHATEVVARVRLAYERKTVESGALFYQEFLPPETIFYCLALAEPSRRVFRKDDENEERKTVRIPAREVLAFMRVRLEQRRGVLQIGGDETIGKGLCVVRLVSGKEGA